jgi:hypothetical protein
MCILNSSMLDTRSAPTKTAAHHTSTSEGNRAVSNENEPHRGGAGAPSSQATANKPSSGAVVESSIEEHPRPSTLIVTRSATGGRSVESRPAPLAANFDNNGTDGVGGGNLRTSGGDGVLRAPPTPVTPSTPVIPSLPAQRRATDGGAPIAVRTGGPSVGGPQPGPAGAGWRGQQQQQQHQPPRGGTGAPPGLQQRGPHGHGAHGPQGSGAPPHAAQAAPAAGGNRPTAAAVVASGGHPSPHAGKAAQPAAKARILFSIAYMESIRVKFKGEIKCVMLFVCIVLLVWLCVLFCSLCAAMLASFSHSPHPHIYLPRPHYPHIYQFRHPPHIEPFTHPLIHTPYHPILRDPPSPPLFNA